MANKTAELKAGKMKAWLGRLRAKLKSPQKKKQFVAFVSSIVYKDIMDHFDKEQGSKGKWKAWSKTYAAHMRRIGRSSNKILQFSGRLKGSISPKNVKKNPTGLEWFTNVKTKSGFPYGWAHDTGFGRLPKRDFLWLSQKGLKSISKGAFKSILGGNK